MPTPLAHNPEFSQAAFDTSRTTVGDALNAPIIGEAELVTLADELYRRRHEDLSQLNAEEQAAIITGKAAEVLPQAELLAALTRSKTTGTPLEIKYGIDPTGANVHWGHAVPMLVLDRLQRMGHNITFVIGGMTAKIGDPTGRSTARPVLDDAQITQNLATYAEQVRPLFDMSAVRVVNNKEWLENYSLGALIDIALRVSGSELLQRDDFRTRLEGGTGLTLAEIMYPVVMAIDSQHLKPDIEIGGKDQLLNLQMCRTVMKIAGQRPEVIITTDMLQGTDGTGVKMSKSLGNYVALGDAPDEVFGKVMSIPDTLLREYFQMLTELQPGEWEQLQLRMQNGDINPMTVKLLLASDIVAAVHGTEGAQRAKANFVNKFSKRNYDDLSTDTPTLNPQGDVMAQLREARGGISGKEVRRLLAAGALRHVSPSGTERKLEDIDEIGNLGPGHLRVGKTVIKLITE